MSTIFFNVETGTTAPMFLVGTHKDIVSDQVKHQYISDVIEEKFKYSVGWANIVEYDGMNSVIGVRSFDSNSAEI